MNWQLLYVAAAPQIEIISILFFGQSSQWIVLFYARKRTLVYTQKWISSWLIRKSIEMKSATSQPWLHSTTITEKSWSFIVKSEHIITENLLVKTKYSEIMLDQYEVRTCTPCNVFPWDLWLEESLQNAIITSSNIVSSQLNNPTRVSNICNLSFHVNEYPTSEREVFPLFFFPFFFLNSLGWMIY